MPWVKDIADDVVALVKCVPTRVRIIYVGLIIILGFGLLYFMEMHKFQIQMAQLERAQAQQIPEDQKSNVTRGFAGGIIDDKEKVSARGSK